MRKGDINETHSPEEIRKKVEERKEGGKGRSMQHVVEAVLLVVCLQLFVALYLRQGEMGMRPDLPIRSDTCPVNGERRILWEEEVVIEQENMGREIKEGLIEREEEGEGMNEELEFKSGAKEEEDEDGQKESEVEEELRTEEEGEEEWEIEKEDLEEDTQNDVEE